MKMFTRLPAFGALAAFFPALVFAQMEVPAPVAAVPRPEPEMQAVLDAYAELKPRPIATLTPEEARQEPTLSKAVLALLKEQGRSASPETVADVDDREIPGPGGDIEIRVYTPEGGGPFPVILYFHGGGFVIADLDTYDATPRALANGAKAVVVSAHYRQGPEHKFPAAHDDALTAYRWVLDNVDSLKGHPAKIAVAGESAGGNLAAYVANAAKEQGLTPPVHQLLVYPITNYAFDTPSYKENSTARPLDLTLMQWFFTHAANQPDAADPRLSLLRSPGLAGVAPATVITAQIDPLRSEGQAYAEKLKAAGVPVAYRNYEGVTHEFFGMGAVMSKAREAMQFATENLRRAFDQARSATE